MQVTHTTEREKPCSLSPDGGRSSYRDEGLVEAVEAEVPDELAICEGRDEPQIEVGDHHKGSAAHHPETREGTPRY